MKPLAVKLITDPTSIYNPQGPPPNRDKRFYQTLLNHGITGKEVGCLCIAICKTGLEWQLSPQPITAHAAGMDCKMMQEYDGASADLYSGAFAQDNNWPYFHYAEVLLNYAEAQNEALAAPTRKCIRCHQRGSRPCRSGPGLPEGLSKDENAYPVFTMSAA